MGDPRDERPHQLHRKGRRRLKLLPRRLGDSAIEVSIVGLGCNNFGKRLDREATAAVLEAALGAGITFFDTADVYGGTESERLIGEVLEGRREEYALATKFGMEMPASAGASGPTASTSTSTTSPTG